MLAGKDLCWLISKTVLLKEIEDNYDCDYGETLIDPRHFYDLVDEQQIIGIGFLEYVTFPFLSILK